MERQRIQIFKEILLIELLQVPNELVVWLKTIHTHVGAGKRCVMVTHSSGRNYISASGVRRTVSNNMIDKRSRCISDSGRLVTICSSPKMSSNRFTFV